MGLSKGELQAKILSGHRIFLGLALAINKLPESETRGELIYKHGKIREKLNNLHIDLERIDRHACYFGFADKCPGVPCDECEYWREGNGR